MRRVWLGSFFITFLTVLGLSLAPAKVQSQTPLDTDEAVLRAFLREAVLTTTLDPQDRAQALREVIAQNPEPLIWMAEGRDILAILRAGGIPFPERKKRKTALAEEIVRQIHRIQNHSTFKVGLIGLRKSVTAVSAQERLRVLQQVPDSSFLFAVKQIAQGIQFIDVSRLEAIESLVSAQGLKLQSEGAPSNFSPSRSTDQLLEQFTQIFGRYFRQLDIYQKAPMIADLLALPPSAPVESRILAVFQNSGIVMQKLLQFAEQKIESPQLSHAAKMLLENIKPFPTAQAKSIIESELKRTLEGVFSSFDESPLKAATTGQIHRARLRETGQEVVIKVLRPLVRVSAQRELSLIEKVSMGTTFEPHVSEIRASLMKELDYRNEYSAIEKGQIYNDPRRGISTVQLAPGFPPSDKILVLQMAPGRSLNSFGETPAELVQKGEILQKVLSRWIEVSLFENGFFNADLHGGNVFADMKDPRNPQITLLDFGNVDELTLIQRRGFVGLALGIFRKNPFQISMAMRDICRLEGEQFASLLKEVSALKLEGLSLDAAINQILGAAVALKLKVPGSLLNFNRGLLFLVNELERVNERLSMIDPQSRLPRFDMAKILMSVTVKRTLSDLGRNLFNSKGDLNSTVTRQMLKEILILGAQRVMDHFSQTCRLFFTSPAN